MQSRDESTNRAHGDLVFVASAEHLDRFQECAGGGIVRDALGQIDQATPPVGVLEGHDAAEPPDGRLRDSRRSIVVSHRLSSTSDEVQACGRVGCDGSPQGLERAEACGSDGAVDCLGVARIVRGEVEGP